MTTTRVAFGRHARVYETIVVDVEDMPDDMYSHLVEALDDDYAEGKDELAEYLNEHGTLVSTDYSGSDEPEYSFINFYNMEN